MFLKDLDRVGVERSIFNHNKCFSVSFSNNVLTKSKYTLNCNYLNFFYSLSTSYHIRSSSISIFFIPRV